MITVDAVLSRNPWGKYVICGSCGKSLCRRDRREAFVLGVGTRAYFDLIWDADWHHVPATADVPAHIERGNSALDRLARGSAPNRRGYEPRERIPSSKGFPARPPALCPYGVCDALNRIDSRSSGSSRRPFHRG